MTTEITPPNGLTSNVAVLAERVEELNAALISLAEDLQRRDRAIRKSSRIRAYAMFSIVLVLIGILAVLLVNSHGQVQTNTKKIDSTRDSICLLVGPIRPMAGDPPPAGNAEQQARSLRVRASYERLYRDFHCEKG